MKIPVQDLFTSITGSILVVFSRRFSTRPYKAPLSTYISSLSVTNILNGKTKSADIVSFTPDDPFGQIRIRPVSGTVAWIPFLPVINKPAGCEPIEVRSANVVAFVFHCAQELNFG